MLSLNQSQEVEIGMHLNLFCHHKGHTFYRHVFLFSDTKKCKSNEFRCESDDACIPESKKCDKKPDCQDKSDESKDTCESNKFYIHVSYFSTRVEVGATTYKKHDVT